MTAIAVLPACPDPIRDAIERAGARVTDDPAGAAVIVWTNPYDVNGLRDALGRSDATWIQLPFAGIEQFVAAGILDPARTWTCAKGIYGPPTAEHAMALTLLAARRLHHHARRTDWLRDVAGSRRLEGTTALVVGAGGIGESYAAFAEPFGMRLLAVNRSGSPVAWAERTAAADRIGELVPQSDWIVVCAAYTPETHHLIGADVIARMKPDAWIVNVARGGLVDTNALVKALDEGSIGGAALDVTDPEPLPDDHPLWRCENAIVTSHTANTPAMALPLLAAMIERNVRAFAAGEPLEGLIDVTAGY